ncbi:MAG: NAD(P)-dependent oxidoreductase [Candidatus Kapaibacterium sp.]
MIIVDDQLPIIARILGEVSDVLCVDGRSINRELLIRTNATALFIRTVTHVSHGLIDGTNVRFIASASAGRDHIDDDLLGYGGHLNIVHAPGCNAQAVAEYVVTWLDHFAIPLSARLGIVGFGNVGSLLARLMIGRGMSVLVNDSPLASLGYAFPAAVAHVDLDELLCESDVVSLHVPFTESGDHPTKGLITAQRMERMQGGATLINTSRGGIVDEAALAREVNRGRLRAVLDVYDNEPNITPEVVRTIPYCSPHIAGYSEVAKVRASRMVLKAYRQWSGLDFAIPEQQELMTRRRSAEEDRAIIVNHPFRDMWRADPTADTFAACRRLTPLRSEHLRPPTWEDLHVLHD